MADRKNRTSSPRRSSTTPRAPEKLPNWCSLSEAALLLNKHKSQITRYITKGDLISNGQERGSPELRVSTASVWQLRLKQVRKDRSLARSRAKRRNASTSPTPRDGAPVEELEPWCRAAERPTVAQADLDIDSLFTRVFADLPAVKQLELIERSEAKIAARAERAACEDAAERRAGRIGRVQDTVERLQRLALRLDIPSRDLIHLDNFARAINREMQKKSEDEAPNAD